MKRPLRFELGRSVGSYLFEQQRRFDPDLYDWQAEIVAQPITASHHAVTCFDQSALLGKPVFFFEPKGERMVVDARAFTTLTVVNATRLSNNERKVVGRLSKTAPAELWAMNTLVEALLRADIIRTYVHIGSTIEVVGAGAIEPGGARLELQGEHEYYTNERNVDRVHFAVERDGTGEISVIGLD